MTPARLPYDLAVSAIDLTRACSAHELYGVWLGLHSASLHGSAGIANYFFLAAAAFEEQAHPNLPAHFDPFVARETLSDLLMASPPLSCAELQAAVTLAIREAGEDAFELAQPQRHGVPLRISIPPTHPKFEREADR